ncbi:MAG: hypothetical protein KDE56_03760 [Anaerolineales bacterium]|nr:hypothetical protein [Anaerolineales bacterium]
MDVQKYAPYVEYARRQAAERQRSVFPSHILLAQQIRGEAAALNRAVLRVQRAWEAAQQPSNEQDMFIDSTALNLHSFYSGLERLLEYAAYQMEGSVPKGRDWRKELLRQMSSELPGLRPAMLQPETVATLDEFRRFRHVVRNVYAEHLDPRRVGELVVRLTAVWHQTHTQLLTFAEFLEGVSRADDLL